MLWDEIELYTKLSRKDGEHTPIGRIGSFLDGYDKGKEDATKWIPCSERLPEDNGAYLVTIQTKTKHPTYEFVYGLYIEVCIRDSRGWMTDENVTAWMLLPEPYKGEE